MNFSLLSTEWWDLAGHLRDLWYGLLYWILERLCRIIDLCQGLVKKLAGIDAEGMLYDGQLINGSESSNTVTGDIVEVIIRSDIVRNLFISLLVLGVILLLIVTFVGVWKTEWDFGKDGNSKTKIINASLKALFNFIAVPVIAFFGIFVGNALLRAIDGATKGDTNSTMTSFVLSSAFSDASRYTYKNEGNNAAWINANLQVVYETDETGNKVTDENGNFIVKAQGILNLFKDSKQDVRTDEILDAFQNNTVLTQKTVQEGKYRIFNSDGSVDARYTSSLEAGEFKFTFDDSTLVSMFFDNSKINYILIYIILIFMIKAMLTITYGLVKRLYYVVILFIISPPIVAMSPINDKALGSWRSMFISNVCSAFVTIGIYNIFLSIYPAFTKITFPNVGNFVNFFVQLLMISVGVMIINELSGEIAKLFGVKDVYSESVGKDGKSLWGGAFKTAGSGFKPFTIGAQAVGKGVQYGMTAKYQGLGAATKQMLGDAKGALSKTPLGDFAKGTGVSGVVKTGGDIHKFRKDMGISEVKKAVKTGRKNAKQASADAFEKENDAIRNIDEYGTRLGLLDPQNTTAGVSALNADRRHVEDRERFMSLYNRAKELKNKKDLTPDEIKERDDLKAEIMKIKATERYRYLTEQKYLESVEAKEQALEDQKQAVADRKILKNSVSNLVKQKNKIEPKMDRNKKRQKDQLDALTRQTAYGDAKKDSSKK